jgi:hypothetical protein
MSLGRTFTDVIVFALNPESAIKRIKSEGFLDTKTTHEFGRQILMPSVSCTLQLSITRSRNFLRGEKP